MILTPEQIEHINDWCYGPDAYAVELYETLRAYAEIVERLTEIGMRGGAIPTSAHPHHFFFAVDAKLFGELFVDARKLRGKE
jgi:hypothetical protein